MVYSQNYVAKICDNHKDWDSYLPYIICLLWPQESTRLSPFELLYRRHVRGPLDVLQECWTRDEQQGQTVEQLLDGTNA